MSVMEAALERVVVPRVHGHHDPMLPLAVVIDNVKFEAPDIATYSLSFVDERAGRLYAFLPGQFNMLYLPGIGEAAISISSDPDKPEKLLHTIRKAGNVTTAISRMMSGDSFFIRGPYGSAWPVDQIEERDLIIVGGGIGLAPLRPVIYHIIRHRERYGQVTILSGARTPADLLFFDEYDAWRAHDIEVIVTVDQADASWRGNVGVVPMMFYRLRPDPHRTIVFTCGPEIMMRFVIYEARARRIPKDCIFVSHERNMKCAVGLCGHCQFGPMFLCKDGPVLSYQRIEPFLGVENF